MSIQLLIVDDHPIVLDGLRRLFEIAQGFGAVQCCRSGEEALAAVQDQHYDVVLLDLRMQGQTGLDVLKRLAETKRHARTVMLTAAITSEELVEAVELGVRGVVMKEASPDSLIDCVRRVHEGESCIDAETLWRARTYVARRRAAEVELERVLTPRELEIVRMVTLGLRNRIIADRLAISEGTVKVHLHNVYDKLGIDGRLELVIYAQTRGIV